MHSNFNIPLPTAVASTLEASLLDKINQKTKPIGALGRLESLALQIGLIQQTLTPCLHQPVVLVFAGDHGVARAGVSPYPQEVTAQMVLNFVAGGAAINVFAKQAGVHLAVVDAGVNFDFSSDLPIVHQKIAHGSRNFMDAPAMSINQCQQALEAGARVAKSYLQNGTNVIVFGEMGIGNTTAAAALMHAICGLPATDCVGRGTGLDAAGVARKAEIVASSYLKHKSMLTDAGTVLATFGGFEIAMMVGAMLETAAQGGVVIVDGFISSAAALVASKFAPHFLSYCVFSHCSDESGHAKMLAYLGVQPLLRLDLRLGEGTGAVLAYPLLQAAVNFLNDMASFGEAGVSQAEQDAAGGHA